MKEKELKVWAFQDKNDGHIYPPDVCPFYATRGEAWHEKRNLPTFYENTKVIAVLVKPFVKSK